MFFQGGRTDGAHGNGETKPAQYIASQNASAPARVVCEQCPGESGHNIVLNTDYRKTVKQNKTSIGVLIKSLIQI